MLLALAYRKSNKLSKKKKSCQDVHGKDIVTPIQLRKRRLAKRVTPWLWLWRES